METLLSIFTGNFSFRWQDLFDLVLLSFIFYRILILIRGTRTIPMLMGFMLLLALYLVSLILDLEATQLLLDNLGQSLVLVLVVLFQNDIRNALAQIGVFTLFRENNQQKRDVVEVLSKESTKFLLHQQHILTDSLHIRPRHLEIGRAHV